MGLYDDPLPPRPPPPPSRRRRRRRRPDNDKSIEDDKDIEDDEVEYDNEAISREQRQQQQGRLFEFDKSGKEKRDLLPPLSRRLDSGIGCYFEPTDRKVVNLIDKTSVHPDDACWALEACKGDITEAWTRISTARRMMLNDARFDDSDSNSFEDEWDADLYSLQLEQEFEQRKVSRREEKKKRDVQDLFKGGGEPDQQWLPKDNPRPVDDEPWFTG